MTVPTWLIVVVCVLLYVLVGAGQTVVMAYRAGRRGDSSLSGPQGLGLMFVWPVYNAGMLFIWALDKADDFLEAVRKRGEESVKPPKNEHPVRAGSCAKCGKADRTVTTATFNNKGEFRGKVLCQRCDVPESLDSR